MIVPRLLGMLALGKNAQAFWVSQTRHSSAPRYIPTPSQLAAASTADEFPWSLPDGTIDASQVPKGFQSGFVSIVGFPNVGKSTLMNALVGDRLSIATNKEQTTRHRVMGVVTTQSYQLIYSDTPGILDPQYKLHEEMMASVRLALGDADVLLAVVDASAPPPPMSVELTPKGLESTPRAAENEDVMVTTLRQATNQRVVIALNKMDLLEGGLEGPGGDGAESRDAAADGEAAKALAARWRQLVPSAESVVCVCAQSGQGLDALLAEMVAALPEAPPCFSADVLTDKPERFFASEMVREAIFEQFGQEVPYSCEVAIKSFKQSPKILKIEAHINVDRDSQKGILIGKKGAAIKKLGIAARESLERFFNKKVHLELSVQVKKGWRQSELDLKSFGYGA
mmetsp:Transcript_19799/g.44891  ORF Transcript_19799/g.44891 Transcript_19799/m.44891 type:complete len:397 (+) Transcript_19799:74-1264(+)